ncbi:hypothetical protein Lesp02_80660 [Lentzea sp. NBRC 105346]|uniref:TIGR02679 domain-containing protein n=1 Tax=Lentzea sp. NBRC 105346 TaxID=3032205 RepID=UPI0024A4B30E|nr:DUF2399 domain-containing protein [Lentzea sp. NBRC 105346]GLZ35879.1 hypothetical protein Lesp02_80660 [Lentzea sp. NBRC 105346]
MTPDRPELAELWRLARETIEAGGRSAFSIRVPDAATADALAEVLRKPIDHPARRQISLARLDEHLRAAGTTLVEVLERVHGRPIGMQAAAEAPTADAVLRYALREHGLASAPWAATWIEQVRRYGKIPQPVLPLLAAQAASVLSRMTLSGIPRRWVSRHALAGNDLDDGRPLARIVLRAAALAHGVDVPRDPRGLWERCGVVLDSWSDPVLTSAGYLKLTDAVEFSEITVCRSARLLESGFPGPLLVLDRGVTAPARHHLARLADAGTRIRCHGDFTPDGVRLVNDVLAWTGGSAWRMTASDYRDAVAMLITQGVDLPTLTTQPPAASWDPDLAETMATTGLQVTEEHLLPQLVS